MLVLHRAERADRLVEALGDVLMEPLDDPITAEVIAVPTRGVERWLAQQLSGRLGSGPAGEAGVCANVVFPFPGTLVGQVVGAACGIPAAEDPWRPERAVWALLDVLDASTHDPQLAPLYEHLAAATPPDGRGTRGSLRRFAVARHLVDLFDHYGVHRPDLIRDWAQHQPASGAQPSSEGRPEDDPAPCWQAHLWRLLRRRLGAPSPAERFSEAAARVVDEPALVELPERVSLFGLTRLPGSHLEVLQALAGSRDVHLWLLHPSGELWSKVAQELDGKAPPVERSGDSTSRLAAHPVLRAWGRDAREMQLVLAAREVPDGEHHPVDDAVPTTLLGRIQDDIRGDRPPAGPPTGTATDRRQLLSPEDRSIQVHACHGPARQVEVVRDAVLHLLDQDPSLEPRDVIVMCPDIETFAPLIGAAFAGDEHFPLEGQGPERGAGLPRIRVRLADRSVRQTNPVLGVAAQLLSLARSRVTASQVLDLAARPPVARRFGLDAEDLSSLQRWVVETGVRWALDGAHRDPWMLAGLTANTWDAGMDRLLLGAAMAEGDGRLFAGVLPYDLPSGEVELAGRVAELLDRLRAALDSLQGSHSAATWADALALATATLTEVAGGEEWQHEQMLRVLADVAHEAAAAPVEVSLPEVTDLFGARLQGRPTRANFRTGDLTVCTLVPMRSVPHRVVVLLGLDDGSFPRHAEVDGDDLLLRSPHVGDRDPRSEDRQLLLDALLAATDHLVITYSARDERTNRLRPPAVPVSELLDTVDATARLTDGRPASAEVVRLHPLQTFDERNFVDAAISGSGPWSYDPVQLAGSVAARDARPAQPFLSGPLPPLDLPVVELAQLVRFVEHPVRAFLQQRLGLYLTRRSDEASDGLPLELDELEKWGVGDRLLRAALAGVAPERARRAEEARGLLPPGPLGDDVLGPICSEVGNLTEAAVRLGVPPGPADSLDVHVELPGGRSLVGTVGDWRGGRIVTAHYSRLGPRHRLAAWVRFLALAAARPDLEVAAVTVGRGRAGHPPAASHLEPFGDSAHERATLLLTQLVDLFDRGMREPLPLCCSTTAEWVDTAMRGDPDGAFSRADQKWRDGNFPGEGSDIEHLYVWGRTALSSLMEAPAGPDEAAWGGPGSRFSALGVRLWKPLLAHERQEPA